MTSYRKRALAVVAAASTAASLAACGGGSSPGGTTEGGTLYYYITKPVEHVDPQRVYVGRDLSNLNRLVYRSLVSFPISTDPKEANTPVADLATDTGTASDDAKTWKFTLKDGVTWQDGKGITCEDVKYGVSRVFATDVITGGPNYILSYLDVPEGKDGLPAYKGPYKKTGQADFDKAVTCEGNTITYHFKKPWPDFTLATAALLMLTPLPAGPGQGRQVELRDLLQRPLQAPGRPGRRRRARPWSATRTTTRRPTPPRCARRCRTRSCSPSASRPRPSTTG